MIKSKGYFEVLKLAKNLQNTNCHFHFAGGWQSKEDENDFFEFIKKYKLEVKVTFHGFINGKQKKALFEKSQLFIFPTRYENEAFPLSILEALSYGVPVLSTDEGSISYILDKKSGIVIKDLNELEKAFEIAVDTLVNRESANHCRERYLNYFSLEQFEYNLVELFR